MSENTFTIRGAQIIDGTDTPALRQDLLVTNGIIAEVGSILRGAEQGKVIDGSDLTLAPGFIDMHAHSDLAVLTDKQHLAKVTQGVTLEVVGQDGLSYVPSNPETLLELREQLFGWNADPKGLNWNFHTVGEYLARVDEGCAVNVAYLIPHGSVRMLVRGNEPGHASADELAAMMRLTRQAPLAYQLDLPTPRRCMQIMMRLCSYAKWWQSLVVTTPRIIVITGLSLSMQLLSV